MAVHFFVTLASDSVQVEVWVEIPGDEIFLSDCIKQSGYSGVRLSGYGSKSALHFNENHR